METLLQDLRYGVRTLAKRPGFTAVAVLTLALGIGANSVIFSSVDVLLLRPLPFQDLDRLVAVWETRPHQDGYDYYVAPANYLDWQGENKVFEHLAPSQNVSINLTGTGEPELLGGFLVGPAFFPALGVAPAAGRTFLPEEAAPGRDQVVVLSYRLWQRRFGGEPNILGRVLTLDARSYTVVGVMPADFEFPVGGADLWLPLALTNEQAGQRAVGSLSVIGRLKPGVSLPEARAEMDTIAGRLARQYPETNDGRGARVIALRDEVIDKLTPAFLLTLFGAVGFVLLIACVNVANLQLARAAGRHREIAVRTALGATRWRVVRQLLTECVVLSAAGAAVGLLLALWGIDATKSAIPPEVVKFVAGFRDMGIDGRVFGFTLVVALLAGILAGLAPALQASKLDLNEVLREGGKGATSGQGRVRSILVVAEVALALVLLVGAGLMVKGFGNLVTRDHGFDGANLLTLRVTLPPGKYEQPHQVVAFYDQVLRGLAALPGGQSVGAINNLPFGTRNSGASFNLDGRPLPPPGRQHRADLHVVSAGYFEAMRIPLRGGRGFTEQDREQSPPVAVISEGLARRYWPGEDPTGRRIKLGPPDSAEPWLTVVGVVGNVTQHWIDQEPRSAIYRPYAQAPRHSLSLVLRASGDPLTLAAAARAQVAQVDRDQPVYELRTMGRVIADSMAGVRLGAAMMAVFGLIALVLAAVGIYGVMSYSVTQRTHELGIRLALGASRGDVLRMVVGQAFKLAVVGVALGLPVAFGLTRLMSSALAGVVALDVTTFAGFTLLLAAVALLSGYLPARRATKVDPMIALRYE